MANPFFRFKQFTVYHDRCAMKVTTDACLFGAWCAVEIKNEKRNIKNVLDIGAGTGLLSLMVAQQNEVKIDAIEIDESAARQAGENFSASPWAENLQIIQGDVATLPFTHAYDCMISNPPFYEKELQSANRQRNVAHHSHQLKLEQLLALIHQHLDANGSFFLLLPFKRQAETETLLQQKALYIEKQVWVHQSPRHAPFRLMIKGRKKAPVEPQKSSITICAEEGIYTPEFTSLLQAYYLYL